MESLHYLLMKAHSMFSRKVLGEVGKTGLTPGQPKVLEFLLQYQEADQKTIAAYCEIEPATVGSILLRMEDSGLIVRRKKNGNRRSLYVSLTDKGYQAALQVADIFHTVETDALAGLSADEAATLQVLLFKLCTSLQTNPERKKEQS